MLTSSVIVDRCVAVRCDARRCGALRCRAERGGAVVNLYLPLAKNLKDVALRSSAMRGDAGQGEATRCGAPNN